MSQEINLSEVVHREFIQPEIDRRKTKGELPEDFQIRECLIKMPGDSPPIVLFNDEFGWTVKPKLAPGIDMQTGHPVYLHEVEDIEEVMPPMIDGKRVTFIYLFWAGYSYSLIVDPYHPTLSDQSFKYGETIADHLRTRLREESVRTVQFITSEKLREIGLWPATSLLSYPMSKIVECIGRGNVEEARQVLVEYCDSDFLARKIVQTWQPISVFRDRMEFFNDALFNHQNKRYHGSISILVGQIEGVITDWLFEIKHYNNDQKRNLKTKIIDLRSVLNRIPDLLWLYRESRDAMLEFLEQGPWLQDFLYWFQSVNTSFPPRHAVQHGKYDKDVFTEENSIKLFLMLDTICQFMMFYEVRVLGRDVGQNANDGAEQSPIESSPS